MSKRRAFTLTELLVVCSILTVLAAVSLPVIGVMMRDTRLGAAVSRLKAGMQQTRAVLTDYSFADRSNTEPAIAGALYTGTALVMRWDDAVQEYEIFYAISAQGASGTGGPTDWLAARATPLRGYARFTDLEPMTLGTGMRVAGLRASQDGTKLELVPSPSNSIAVCMDATGVGIPPAPAIYVNLQSAPAKGGSGPWNTWDITMYDAAGTHTGAYAEAYEDPYSGSASSGVGEGFFTSLPMLIVYRDDDLPMTGQSASGQDWRVANPDHPGSLMVNPRLDPNELLAQTRGRVVMLTMQGGSPAEY